MNSFKKNPILGQENEKKIFLECNLRPEYIIARDSTFLYLHFSEFRLVVVTPAQTLGSLVARQRLLNVFGNQEDFSVRQILQKENVKINYPILSRESKLY